MAQDMAPRLAAEFVGTFMLVFTVGCNVLSGNNVWGGVSIACVLMVAIYALAGISGANFNPAVSFALGLVKNLHGPSDMDWPHVAQYIGVQVLGGLAASFLYLFLFKDSFNLAPASGFGLAHAGACEFLYTFMLVFVVLNVAVARKNAEAKDRGEPNEFFGLAIGFVIVAGAYGAGAVSGGCFNPAVAIAIDVSSAFYGIGWCAAYTAFELAGAAFAVGLYKVIRPEDFPGGRPADPQRREHREEISALASEFIGTYMLVVTVGLNVLGKSPAGAYSIAASLMCMIYALGDVSGAHFNPAVTLAIAVSNMDESLHEKHKMFKYMGVQILGGIAASCTYSLIHHRQSFGLGPQGNITWTQVGMAEVLFTMLLCYVVLCVACVPAGGPNSTNQKQFFGLAIGSCVTVGGFAIGGISGGSLNPAVSVGIQTSHCIFGDCKFIMCVFYSVYEFLGACIAAGMLGATHALPKSQEVGNP